MIFATVVAEVDAILILCFQRFACFTLSVIITYQTRQFEVQVKPSYNYKISINLDFDLSVTETAEVIDKLARSKTMFRTASLTHGPCFTFRQLPTHRHSFTLFSRGLIPVFLAFWRDTSEFSIKNWKSLSAHVAFFRFLIGNSLVFLQEARSTGIRLLENGMKLCLWVENCLKFKYTLNFILVMPTLHFGDVDFCGENSIGYFDRKSLLDHCCSISTD